MSRVAITTLSAFAAYLALAATASADLGRVVAVGDSLAAGTKQGPAIGTYPKCGQTSGSYVELAMARVKKSAWVNSVCNGGHSGVMEFPWYGIDGSAANGDPVIAPQFDSLNGSEDVVIVGSGANEAFFGQISEICIGHKGYSLSDNACSMRFGTDGVELRSYTVLSEQRVGLMIDEIDRRSPNAKVILVGIPRITPRDGVGCMPNPVLTLDDAPVWAVWEDTLRQSMIKVATEHDATYVDNEAISGPEHSMCAPVNMRWMNPWTVANVPYPGTALHNTPWGADAMADTLVSAIKSAGRNTGTPNAPTLTRTLPSATPTKMTSQILNYSGAAGHTFKCRLDNAAYATCSGGVVTLSNLSAGPHSYSVIQTNASGYRSPAALVTWTVDVTAPVSPTVTRTSPVSTPTNSTTQTITYAAAESGGTFQCKLDSASYAACAGSPASLSGLTNGSHTYYVTQTDAAGNVSPASSVTWTVNTTPPPTPNVVRTSPSAAVTNSTTQVITYSGNQAGGTFQCKLDSAQPTGCPSSPLTLTGLGNGAHSFTVTQTDALGNVSSAATVVWTVDLNPPAAPTVNRTSPTASPTNSATQTITFTGSEAGGTLHCTLDSAAYAECPASPVTLTGLGGGSHAYSVRQTDAAGNVGLVATVSWTIDITPPPIPIVSGPSGVSALNSASITYSDAEAGVSFQCKLDSAPYAACPASPVSLSGLANAAHTYYVTATDAAGNTSGAGSASWTVDPSGFTVSITASPSNPATVTTASFSFAASVVSGTTYECKLDAGAFTSCSSPKTYDGLPNGSHTFTVHGVNVSLTTPDVSRTWVVDTIPPGAPTLTRTSPTASPTNLTAQTFSLAAAESGGVLGCKLDNDAVSTCPSSPITITGLGNGPHSFTATQTDAAGNTGSAATVTWSVDTSPPIAPVVARTSPTANPTNFTSQALTYSGIEGSATAQCKLDTAAFGPCPASPLTFTGLGEGSHTLVVTQTDSAGNVSASGSVSWVVDSVAPSAPSVTRTSPTDSPSNSTTQEISLAGTEASTSLQCKLDSSAYSQCPSSPATYSGLSQGAHTLLVTQTDAAANVSAPASVSWTIDSIAPGAPTIGFNRPAVTVVNSATIGFTPAEAGGTFECSMDSSPWMPCPGNPINLISIPDGGHNYMIRQIDAAGNEGSVAQVAWVVDTVVPPTPTVALTSPTSSPTYQRTASITVTENESGGKLECKLDNAAYAICPSSPVSLTNLSFAAHTYSVRQTDTAGNISGVASATWVVEPDTTAPLAPTVTRTNPAANPTTSTSQIVTYSGAEAGGTFQCKLDAGAYTSCQASPVTTTGLASGTHTVSITQTDSSGNVSPAGIVTWTVDSIAPGAPSVTRTAPIGNPTSSTSQAITYVGAEAGGTFQCKLDSASFAACPGSPISISDLLDGTHSYSITQTDAAGNVGSATTVTWTVDSSPPSNPNVTRTAPTANPTNSTLQTITYSGEASATFQCKLDGAAYDACPSSPVTLTNLSGGSHSYSVTQTDLSGNVSPPTTVAWSIDTTPPSAPTVTRSSPAGTPTNSTSQTIAYSGLEPSATAQCKLDSAAYSACSGSPFTLSGLAGGTHTLSITQTDSTGNPSSANSVTWVVDVTAPPTPIVSGPSGTYGLTTASVAYSDFESGVTFQCRLDSGSYAACPASPVGLTGLSNGAHTYYVTATDAAGNTSAAGAVTWTVDTTGFSVSITSAPSALSTATSASFEFVSTITSGTSYECKLDGGAYSSCSSPKVYTGLTDGSRTFAVRGVNGAQTTQESNRTWSIDATAPSAPTITRTSPTANPTNSTSQTVTYSGAEAGGSFQCKLDAGAFAPCASSPITLNGLVNGPHTVSVTQTDSSGNISPAGSATWTVDSIAPGAPTVTRTAPTGNPTPSTSQAITYAGAEAGGTFVCKLDAGSYAPCPSSPVALSGLTDGARSYSVAQTDAAGNAGSATTVTWVVDTSAPTQPTVTRSSPSANPTNSTSQTITFSGEPGGSFQCKLDAAAYAACPGSPVTLTALTEGSHSYSVLQSDALGNVGAPTTLTWTVDTTAPSAPTTTRSSPTGTPTNSTSQVIAYGGLEAGATAQCKLDSAAAAACPASPVTVNGLAGGTHSYAVTQTDAAGNVSAADTASWVVDVTAPPTPNVNGPSGTSGLITATVSYSNPESGVTFQCKLDSAAYAACPASPVSLSGLANGAHIYYVTATDNAGNVSAAGTATWIVDPSGFNVAITSAPDDPSTLATASFAFVATITPGTTYECKLDSGNFGSCSSPKSFSNLTEGSHTFTVRAVNGAQTSPVASRAWVVDSIPPAVPTLARTSPTATPTNSNSQSLAFAAAEPGGVLNCKVNGSAYLTCPSSPVTLPPQSDGVYTFSVTQTDSAGHTSDPATITWVIDTTAPAAPTVSRLSPTESPTVATSQTITYNGEAASAFECKLDGGAYAPCSASPLTLGSLSLGAHTFWVRQTDEAGNTSPASEINWTIEPNVEPPPIKPIVPTNPPVVPPELTAVLSSVAPKSIVPARSGGPFSLNSKFGVAGFNVTLSSSAKVRIRLERVVSRRAARASTSWAEFKLKSGRTTIRISGRDAKRALAAGSYRVRLTVPGTSTDVVGKTFRIKR